MTFAVRTLRSPRRYFLVEVRSRSSESLENVHQQITALFLRLFGSSVTSKVDLQVFSQTQNHFICSVPNEFAVSFRCAIALPPIPLPHQAEIEGFRVLSESSFMQSLFHNSRLDFPPLT
jgi:hypothetical protein